MRFVPVKTRPAVDPNTAPDPLINSIHAHLAEFGIIAGIGRNGVEALRGTRISPSGVSELNKKIYVTIEAWRRLAKPFLMSVCPVANQTRTPVGTGIIGAAWSSPAP
jgi:hypothetical protein